MGRGGDDDGGKWCCACFICVCLIVGSILLGLSFSILTPVQVGLDYDGTTLQLDRTRLYENGRWFLGVGHYFFPFNITLQTIEFSANSDADAGPLAAGNRDGQAITLELSFMYRIRNNVDDVVNLYDQYALEYQPAIVKEAQSTLKNTATQFTTDDYFNNRTFIKSTMQENLQAKLSEIFHIDVERVQLRNIDLTPGFESKIVDKIVSAQEKKTAEQTQLAKIVKSGITVLDKYADANITVIQTTANAEGSILRENAKALAVKELIDAEGTALKLLRDGMLNSNDETLNYIWTQILRNDGHSKLLVGLDQNPAIVSAA